MSAPLNIAGLIMNLAGVILLFRYGMPYRVRSEGLSYLVTESVWISVRQQPRKFTIDWAG